MSTRTSDVSTLKQPRQRPARDEGACPGEQAGALPAMPEAETLDLQAAADLLMVSRNYLMKLIGGNVIKCVDKNGEKAVLRGELQRYQEQRRKEQGEVMRELDAMIEA